MVEKYYNENNELGVLISRGFGAGWSTWNCDALAYDKRVVEKWLDGATSGEMKAYVVSLGYPSPYMGGYNDLQLEFIPRGTVFRIHEYDGSESIETLEDMGMIVA